MTQLSIGFRVLQDPCMGCMGRCKVSSVAGRAWVSSLCGTTCSGAVLLDDGSIISTITESVDSNNAHISKKLKVQNEKR